MGKQKTKEEAWVENLISLIRENITIQEVLNRIAKWDNKTDRKKATKLMFRFADSIDEISKKPWLTFGGQKKLIKKYKLQELESVING